ncbi:hypothetical protein GUITHDRAFT_93085 [Guillardia theta CCMP2712]|uniref:Phosphate acetyltransferase n=3 Tax=Guillardia theta TaxID=55529 RepID=L1JP48_GUITC|nr:hypothetical protein GUITHDRAFT_93085 [Guillardia theta CCMP2712]EKX50351.1 hypothetical protein GUITHDRAFT_93085 [Guillardia theta CCMP2712]|eukprot:XP_005837331.1 hypothetical protein GUITHDRAFT_93085 [Guillardia theta CCMP2712]
MTAVEEVGLLYAVLPRAPRVGYFRPFAEGENDRSISLMRSIFRLDDSPEVMQGITVAEATKLLSHGQEKELFDQILSKYVEYRKGKDFVLVSCGRLENDSHFWSQKMAAALNLPVLLISDVGHESDLAIIKGGLESSNVKIAGVLMSGLPPGNEYAETANECKEAIEQLGLRSVGMLPKSAIIHQVTMAEVVDALGAKVFFGEESLDRSIVKDITVATLDMNRMLHRLRVHPGTLVIVHSGRADVLLSLVLAARSSNYPRPAGILLTGSRNLDPDVDDILCGLNGIAMPVIGVEEDTFACTTTLLKHRPVLLPSSTTKIEAAQVLFQKHIDPKFLNQLVATNADDYVVTPKLFQHNIFSAARTDKQRIVLPEGDDPRVLAAAGELLARNLCEVTILGKEDLIQNKAKRNHVSLKGAKIVDPETETTEEMVDALYNARKSKGMTKELARDMLQGEPNWFGTMMMYLDQADGMVSGACHSTAATMRPALQVIKMAPGFSLVSSVFFMLLPGRVLVFGDCAINVDPTADELAEIAVASAHTARAFGILPRVAMLSYATGDSNQGPMIDKVREATKKARLLAPNELIEGPIQFDAAVDPAVAAVKYKGQDSPVAGKATVLVFPDLNAGNNAYKAVQQASKSIAVGPIMQGLRKPVNDLSRGCTIDDIVNTVVVTCLQSKASKELAKK